MPGPEPLDPARPRRLGLLGGTFDPPHLGHLAAAVGARDALDLDRVLLVVANDPWQKTPRGPITAAPDRLAMVEAAALGLERVEASRIEIDRGGPSYTIDTVHHLQAVADEAGVARPDLFLIVGADLVETLPTWERFDQLARLVTLAVVSRPPGPGPEVPPGWQVVRVEGPSVDVSSSTVRRAVARGDSVDPFVPPEVVRCIRRRSLYAGAR